MKTALFDPNGVYARLRDAAGGDWDHYIRHDFVTGIRDGSLPEAAFRHYLIQDYLFLIHFARAYALAAYKSRTLEDIRAAAAVMSGIVETEMGLHVSYCADWGLTEDEMAAAPEATQTMAYTRYVLEAGHAGDLLDLYVALAPCVVGYGEIGAWLAADPDTVMQGNPYASWIEMYAGDEYRDVARGAVDQLERLAGDRVTPGREVELVRTFSEATRLEIGFWQMGLDAA